MALAKRRNLGLDVKIGLSRRHQADAGDFGAAYWGRNVRDNIKTVRYVDPANTNNVVSDDCTKAEKVAIAGKARESLAKKVWNDIVW